MSLFGRALVVAITAALMLPFGTPPGAASHDTAGKLASHKAEGNSLRVCRPRSGVERHPPALLGHALIPASANSPSRPKKRRAVSFQVGRRRPRSSAAAASRSR